jgi:hypothetical protein
MLFSQELGVLLEGFQVRAALNWWGLGHWCRGLGGGLDRIHQAWFWVEGVIGADQWVWQKG